MGNTDGVWSQKTPFTDGQIFIGASEFVDIAGLAARANPSSGLYAWSLGATHACTFVADVSKLLKVGGIASFSGPGQQAFGTAAAVPGPSGVAGTSGPDGTGPFPPNNSGTTTLATLHGPTTIKKGLQINSIDVVYNFLTNNGTVAQVGITQTKFVSTVAPTVANILALGTNGLSVVANAQQLVIPVAIASPAMITNVDTEILVNVNLTSGAGGGNFYGVVLKTSYNYN